MCFHFACNLQYEIVVSVRNLNFFLFMRFHSAINIFIRHCLSAISSEGLNLVALVKVCLLSDFFYLVCLSWSWMWWRRWMWNVSSVAQSMRWRWVPDGVMFILPKVFFSAIHRNFLVLLFCIFTLLFCFMQCSEQDDADSFLVLICFFESIFIEFLFLVDAMPSVSLGFFCFLLISVFMNLDQ